MEGQSFRIFKSSALRSGQSTSREMQSHLLLRDTEEGHLSDSIATSNKKRDGSVGVEPLL